MPSMTQRLLRSYERGQIMCRVLALTARCVCREQSAAIGYGIVLPFAVYLHDYLAVAYPLADGAYHQRAAAYPIESQRPH